MRTRHLFCLRKLETCLSVSSVNPHAASNMKALKESKRSRMLSNFSFLFLFFKLLLQESEYKVRSNFKMLLSCGDYAI